MLKPDPLLLYPLVCQIQTPHGLIDLNNRLPKRGGITITELNQSEVKSIAEGLGVVISGGSCQAFDSESSSGANGAGGGFKITLKTELGAEYALIRPAQSLRRAESVTLLENYTNRYTLRAWAGLIVTAAPGVEFYQHAVGAEFHNVTLEFLFAGGLP